MARVHERVRKILFRAAMRTLLAVAVLLSASGPASAQYFGRNKVQYKDFQFQVLQTEHFDIYFYPEGRQGVDLSARLAERWHARLSRLLAHNLRGRQPLVLYASHPDFEQTNVIQGELGEGVGGVTESLRRRVVLPLAGPLADTDHVIGHELVHAFQFDMTSNPDAPPGQSGANRLPLWFIEGMAEYLSIGPVDSQTGMWIRDAILHDTLPSLRQLDDPKYFPYRWGHAFWAYVGGRWGDQVIPEMLTRAAASNVDAAVQSVLGVSSEHLSADWHAAMRQVYDPMLTGVTPPAETGRVIVSSTDFGSEINVGPALSPDGRRLAFLSSRGLFSIDLYLADASTGRVVRKLTSTASSPHLSSLQFISSAGAWDSSGRRLAVATVVSGRPALAMFDTAEAGGERVLPLSMIDEAFNPTWAPDGRAIAFAGMKQGLTDLYILDLESSALRRLTDDAYADVQPAWSPDGRQIAFATDRFSTDLQSLATGPYRVALLEVETGAVRPLGGPSGASSLNPQWSPDGAQLYVLAAPDGIQNLYRVAIADGRTERLTSVATGLTGITPASPALSVAQASGAIAVSVFSDTAYSVHLVDPGTSRALPGPVPGGVPMLPPAERRPSDVAALLADPTRGLPAPTTYPVVGYSPGLSLEGFGQPVIAIGASQFGAAFGAGVSFSFGDMLGRHRLATAVQFSSGLSGSFSAKDIGAQVGYLNQTHRWNWGIVGGQSPYLTGAFQAGVGTTPQGEPVEIQQTIIYRQTERNVSGLVAYPFNRARRFELTGGLTRISFDQVVQTRVFSLVTGGTIADDTVETALAPPLTLGTSAAAFVSDTSNVGATSPVQGERYRLEVAPTFGALNFTGLLGDYRRYVMPVSFYTFAFRALHYGRYGVDGEDPRLSPLYLGYPTLVRGYDVNSFDASECVATTASPCPAFDRLVGSRLLVGNAEFRLPLLRPFGASRRMYGPLPVEVGAFADGGVAWNAGEGPSLFGGERRGVASVGLTVRASLGGYAIGQFDVVRPLQRPQKGWVVQFNLTPGF